MDEYLRAAQKRFVSDGAISAYILPYPYKNGHFLLRYADGRKCFADVPSDILKSAAASWNELPSAGICCGDMISLRLNTYAALLSRYDPAVPALPNTDEALLMRCIMDRGLAGMRGVCLELLALLYPAFLQKGVPMGILRAAALRLLNSAQ